MGLPVLGSGAADMDAVGCARGQGAGTSGGVAGVPKGQRPAAACTARGRRGRLGGALYRLHGMYLVVPLAPRAAEDAVKLGRDAASTVWPTALCPSTGPLAVANRPASVVALGARLCGGELGLGATMDSGLRPSHLS